ncbi:homoserine kinase [Alteromonas halophila]|uniref:Homoserine kinase n=1 Tax=Alteromonas halophila TaxID=516698 RepID=A0A918N155_9ALTE|nr:homoserine kinase [Alteromonas halophila]GGW97033.1 homoserine kinase [Alteromonas halophila]
MKAVRAYAPASIGNFSVGYDVLGAALAPVDGTPLGDEVTVEPAQEFSLRVDGPFAHKLPGDSQSNIVTRCYHYFCQALEEHGHRAAPCAMTLHKNLPIGSGLGSSASSIVAAFQALNVSAGSPFDDDRLLAMMGELEGQISGSIHYDNVAPCFLGSMTLMTGDSRIAVKLPVPDSWYVTVCYSGISVSTAQARDILPKHIPMQDTLTFGRQLAVFVHALYQGESKQAAAVVNDVIAEPWRKQLLPAFDECREKSLSQGALAFGISGSGPTVFALCERETDASNIAATLTQTYIQNNDGFAHVCRVPAQGALTTEL